MQHRVRYKPAPTSGGGGGPSGDADIVLGETLRLPEQIRPTIKFTTDTVRVADKIVINPLKFTTDTLRFTSRREVPQITVLQPEDLSLPEVMIGRYDDIKVGRSGTPNSDFQCDGWTDGVAIRNGDNHGNESPLVVSGALLLATTTYGWLKWGLISPFFTGIAHRTGVGTCRISIWMSQGLAVLQTVRLNISTKAADPFTESTLNWTNQPTLGGNQVTRSISVLVGATNGRYDIDMTAAEFAPFIGNWMLLRLDSDAVLATPINVVSREGATGERPLLAFSFKST